MKVVFALGNPEPKYVQTRHNTGFTVLNAFADNLGIKWKSDSKYNADIAETEINGEKVLLVKPATYYNETGQSAQKIINFYKLNPSDDLLVIHDDLALPFGTIRIRQKGSDAGNNGVKSINSHVENGYTRIRIGISNENREKMDDADFVIEKFNSDESKRLKSTIVPQALELIGHFVNGTLKITSYKNIE